MVNKQYAQPFFNKSMSQLFKLGSAQDNHSFYLSLEEVKNKQVELVKKLGWYESSSYLESVALVCSEIYEIYSVPFGSVYEQMNEQASIETIDVMLRLFVLIDRLENQQSTPISFEQVIFAQNPIDNRFEDLDVSYKDFDLDTWLYSLYNKTSQSFNSVRGLSITSSEMESLISIFNQVIYMCVIVVLGIHDTDPAYATKKDFDKVIKYFELKLYTNKRKLDENYVANTNRHK